MPFIEANGLLMLVPCASFLNRWAATGTFNATFRLGFAILLTFFRERGRSPRDEAEVEAHGIAVLNKQLDVPIDGETFFTSCTVERLRAEIRVRFGFREATVADAEMLAEWLRDHVVMDAFDLVKRFADTKDTSPANKDVPLDGVVRGLWREAQG